MVYRVPEDKTKIIEKNKEVKKGSKSIGVLASRNLITKGKKVKREVKKLVNKGVELWKASCTREVANYPKSTAKQVSKHHTTPPQYINGFALLFKAIHVSFYV